MTAQRLHTVTGAAGYTGRYITQLLLQQGHRVQSITGHPGRPNPFGDRVPLHPFDFDRPDLLRQTLEGSDTLFNTYWIRVDHDGRTHQQCVEQTKVMFQAARAAGVRRIVHNIAWTLRKFPAVFLPGRGEYGIQPVFVEDLAELPVQMGERGDRRRRARGLLLRDARQDHQEQDRRQVRRTTDAGQNHLPGGKSPGPDAGQHRPHPGRDPGTLPKTPGIQVRRASPLPHQAE